MREDNFLEKRAYPRLYQEMPLKLLLKGFDLESETKNISASGLYCQITKPLDLMTKLKIILIIPLRDKNKVTNKKIICSGVIVRKEVDLEGVNHIAIFFTDIKKADQEKIAQYVKENI